MAQVYQFVDQNGETRLFAEIDPDPAGTFNGGTISTPLTIDLGSLATAGGVEITGTSGANVKRLGVDFLHTILSLTGDGVLTLSSDDSLGVTFSGTGGTTGTLTITSEASSQPLLDLDASAAPLSGGRTRVFASGRLEVDPSLGDPGLEVKNGAGNLAFSVMNTGQAKITAPHTAPADGDLAAGDCALWFDQTDGAGKLMIKAKTANGTVATGSVSLA